MNRREFAAGLAAAGIAGANLSQPAVAQLAGRTIKLVYGFPAGGGGDALARVIADRLGKVLGASVVVENKAGASGVLSKTVDRRGAGRHHAAVGPLARWRCTRSSMPISTLTRSRT